MLRRVVLLIAVTCALPSLAAADGGFVKRRAALRQALAEPNQKALIYREGGRETLLLQVRYEGDIDEFGWIVPVPSRPKLTAGSIAVFYELADLTVPPSQLQGGKIARGGGGGVSVVEQVEVGPYDATVLAATDPEALAGWLREHDYALPPGAESVLRPYVDRGWYYVALRVRAKEDLLSQFQRIDPGLRSLDEAPERLTEVVMSLVDTQPSPGARKVEAIQKAIGSATGEPEDPETVGGRSAPAARGSFSVLSYAYHEYVRVRQDLEAGRLPSGSLWKCVSQCADGPRGKVFRTAAKQAGLDYGGSDHDIGSTISVAAYHDLRNDVPYARSRFGKLHGALGDRVPKENTQYFEETYELARTALADAHRQPGAMVDLEALQHAVDGPQGAPQGVAHLLATRNDLVVTLQRETATGCDAAQQALGGGTLAPLQLSFATKELVYPLRISSLNEGTTKIQLYVLSNHRVAADRFDTAYAAPLEAQLLPWQQELWKLVGPGRTYLTKLVATMEPSDMDRDVVLTRSKSQDPYGVLDRPGPRGQRPSVGMSGGGGRQGALRGRRGPYR
jgi:hypothetical protein